MRTLVALAVLLWAAPDLDAQEARSPRIASGDQIRLTAAAQPVPVDGTVVEVGHGYVRYTVGTSRDNVQQYTYTPFDTLAVRHRSRGQGALHGAMWGVFLGASLGFISGPFAAGGMDMDTGPAIAVLGGAGSAAGGVFGAATGALIRPASWTLYAFQ